MTTETETAARVKPKPRGPRKPQLRTIRVEVTPSEVNPQYVLAITTGKRVKRTEYYTVEPFANDMGAAFHVRKFGSGEPGAVVDTYQVLISEEGSYCVCPGFLKCGRCKHCDGLKKLLAEGKIVWEVKP